MVQKGKLAAWAAAAAAGHVGRARHLARDESARLARKAVLDIPLSLVSLAACLNAADDLVGVSRQQRIDHGLQQAAHQVRRGVGQGFAKQAGRVDNMGSGHRDDSFADSVRG